jgi:hypothetical protein
MRRSPASSPFINHPTGHALMKTDGLANSWMQVNTDTARQGAWEDRDRDVF